MNKTKAKVRVGGIRSWDREVENLSPEAFRCWVRGLERSVYNATDGELTARDIENIGGTPRARKELFDEGLWQRSADGRVFIRGYLDHNPSRAEVEARRVKAVNRMRNHRANIPDRKGDVQPTVRANKPENIEANNEVRPLASPLSLSSDSGSSPDPESSSATSSDPKDSSGSARESETRAKVTAVFEAWKAAHGKKTAKLDRKRDSRIRARLREGFTVEQLCLAIRNAKNDPFLMGENDGGRPYLGIQTLLRDAEQVERLAALDKPLEPHQKPSGTFLTAPRHQVAYPTFKREPRPSERELVPAADLLAFAAGKQ